MFQASPEGNLLDETSCLGVEELVVGLGSESSAGRSEACDVVVGRGGLAVGHSRGSHCCCVCEGWVLQSVGGSVSGGENRGQWL
jgi:hypothetical protein